MRALLVLGLSAFLATSAHAATNMVRNGSFENGITIVGQTILGAEDDTSINNWTVAAQGVTYNDNNAIDGWDASAGVRSVELSTGVGSGGVFQKIMNFNVGRTYRLAFDVSANPYDTNFRPRDARVRFSVTGNNTGFFDYQLQNVNTQSNMLYERVTFDWQATARVQQIGLRNAVNPFLGYGVVVDNVSVFAVPEASSWAMLIVGFGLIGVAQRRRIRAVVA